MGSFKQIREQAGLSQLAIAARSGKSLPTVRVFEADPDSVTARTRAALEPVYTAIAAELKKAS